MNLGLDRLALVFACFFCVLLTVGCGSEQDSQDPNPDAGAQKNAQTESKPSQTPQQAAPKLRVVKVEPMSIPTTVEYTAKLAAKETVDVRARVAGILEKRHFKEGSHVEKGELLFTIDPEEYAQTLDQAKAELERNKALLENAQKEYERFKTLYEKGVVSKEEYDQKQTNMRELKANVEAQQAAVGSARLSVDYTRVTAPIAGLIGRAQVEQGSLVGKNDATLLATITSINPIYANFSISENDYLSYVKAHTQKDDSEKTTFQLVLSDGSLYPHPGAMDMVDPTVDPDTGAMGVRISFPNPDGLLKPGLFGRVRITIAGGPEKLYIPSKALMDIQGVKQVFTLGEGNKAGAATVTLGQTHGDLVVVESGLKAGDVVLTDGLLNVKPGMVIDPQPVPLQPAGQHNATKPASDA